MNDGKSQVVRIGRTESVQALGAQPARLGNDSLMNLPDVQYLKKNLPPLRKHDIANPIQNSKRKKKKIAAKGHCIVMSLTTATRQSGGR